MSEALIANGRPLAARTVFQAAHGSPFRFVLVLALFTLTSSGIQATVFAWEWPRIIWFWAFYWIAFPLVFEFIGAGTARRYEILPDRIQIVGVVRRRSIPFSKVVNFRRPDRSIRDHWLSVTRGWPADSKVQAMQNSFSSGSDIWVEDTDEFLVAANAALARWQGYLLPKGN